MRFLFRLFVLILALVAVTTAVLWYIASRGISARAQPTALEEAVAIRLRAFATPAEAKSTRNPVADSPAAVRDGLEHFADHCAICHANNGSGHTELSEGLYPKPPDLRATRTQSLTDGELYYIIQNGVRFTGMPAFGDSHGADDTWHLVRFIRHLPALTPAEVEAMKKLNPTSPAERDEEHEEHHHRE